MKIMQNTSRSALVTAIAALALVSVANATQTINVKVPNSQSVTYNLAAGAISAPINVVANLPVHVMGVQTALGFRGVASVDLLSVPGAGGFIEWVGLDSTAGAAITQGFSGVVGTKIVFLDFSHCVKIEVAGAAGSNQIQVHNSCAIPATGSVTLIW